MRQIQSLSVASAPSPPPPPFERESSRRTSYLFSRNQSILARHPLKSVLLLAARVPLIDLIEERSSFHEICTNREEREYRKRAAALFPNLVFRNAFPRTFAPQFNFDFAARASKLGGRRDPFCTLIGTKVWGRGSRRCLSHQLS